MHLTLKNFRSFSSAEFDLSDDFVLLSGRSGSGKTTIIMGIMFALTGEGKKLMKHGAKTCKVTLVIEDLTIVRTKTPNRLQVFNGCFKYEDKLAQSMIDSRFKNVHLGYVSQRLYKSFILMSPSDKVKYIEAIILDKEFVCKMQQKCKDLIKYRRRQTDMFKKEKDTRESVLEDMKCDAAPSDDREPLRPTDSIDSLMEDKKSIERNILSVQSNAERKAAIDQLREEIANTNTIDVSVEEITRQRILASKRENYTKLLKTLDSMPKPGVAGASISEIDNKIEDMKLLINLNTNIENLEGVEDDLYNITRDMENLAIQYRCPSCASSIGLLHDTLILMSSSDGRDVDPVSYDLFKAMDDRKRVLQNDANRLRHMIECREKVLCCYEKGVDPSKKRKLLQDQKEILIAYNDQKRKCEEAKIDDDDGETPTYDVKDVKLFLEKQEKQKMLDRLERNFAPSKYTLEELNDQLKKIEASISLFHWTKVRAAAEKMKEYELSTSTAVELQTIVSEAERAVIRETIETLNVYVQSYLTKFAPNVNVDLVFDDLKLTTDVFIDGHESDINSLSGGEVARVILAFTLALAEMNDIKFLMLDESVASLDQDTTTTVIETIKNNFSGKVICVAHQTMKGIFDRVIEL